MSIIVKCKALKEMFKNGDFKIIAFEPFTPVSEELKLSEYLTFSCKGEYPYITIGKEYDLELELISCNEKYGGTYRILSVLNLEKLDLHDLTREESYEILMDCTSSEKIANNILEAYPNFIEMILINGAESIDVKLIKGVGKAYLKAYTREIVGKYKYYHIIQKFKDYKIDISDAKSLCDAYKDEFGIEKMIKESPYKVLKFLGRAFESSDRMIMELRQDLKVSEQRCAYLILSVLERNEFDGSTRLNGNILYNYIENEYNVPELLPLVVKVVTESDLFHYDKKSQDLAIMTTYLAECKISDFIKNKIKDSIELDIDWEKYKIVEDFSMSQNQSKALEMFCKYSVMILAGYSGSGKAQPNSTLIPTPNGYKFLGELKVGDIIYDRKGKETTILKIYPQGKKDVYEITLSDGRKTLCNDEHLWSYYNSNEELVTKTLRQMMKDGINDSVENMPKYKIPLCEKVEKPIKNYKIHPYVIGSFLGNGNYKEKFLCFSSKDEDNIKKVANLLGCGYKNYINKNYDWYFYSLKNSHIVKNNEIFTEEIRNHICKENYKKSIPKEYINGSISQRYELLQGLFDTDGSISNSSNRYVVSYSTTSEQLKNDILQVIYSLGYSASCSIGDRNKRICYKINLLIDNIEKEEIFSIKRKKDIAIEYSMIKEYKNYKTVSIIEVKKLDRQEEMTCICVDNEEHLYLTNDYIVTHNTTSIKGLISLMEDNHLSYCLLAPTGKASMKITEQLNKNRNVVASTIHKRVLKDGNINSDVIIIDEMSMVDLPTFILLLNAISNEKARIIFVGDPSQLLPVGIASIFNDMVNSQKIPMVMLTEIFRYNTNGGLFVATNVRQGKHFFDSEETDDNGNKIVKWNDNVCTICNNYKFIQTENIIDTVVKEYNNLIGKGIKPSDILCLSPFNVGTEGTYVLNNTIQKEINPLKPNEKILTREIQNNEISFKLGDRVLNKKNDYGAISLETYELLEKSNGVLSAEDVEMLSIFNGQDGVIRKIDDKKIVVQFDEELIVFNKLKLKNLLLAYAISVHSSQGSESLYVINIISPSHKKMLNRNLLYVADTRSKIKQIDIGDATTYNNALLIDGNEERDTWLKDLLMSQ